MKLGILSYHYVRNYGAVLQNYALQHYINETFSNVTAITIDYRCKYLINNYNKRILTYGKNSILDYSIKDVAKYLIGIKYYFRREKVFKRFINTFIKPEYKKISKKNLSFLNDKYDGFVSGSDQVFNVDITKDDYTYYLDFVSNSKTKLCYSASVRWGKKHENNYNRILQLLDRFDGISLRETCDANILKSQIKNIVNVNIDPTLLLTKEEWQRIEEKIDVPERYVLFFELINAPYAAGKAAELAEKNKCKVIFISSDDKPWKYKDMLHLQSVSPNQFIYLINNAKYIFTNSFHGMMFSIIFKKQFFCQTTFNDKRMQDALNLIGMNGYYQKNDYGVWIDNTKVYTDSNFEQKLSDEKYKSKHFFEKYLRGCNEK